MPLICNSRIDSQAETPTLTREWIQKVTTTEKSFLFAIELSSPLNSTVTFDASKDEDTTKSNVIGTCGIFIFPEVGYILDNPYWRNGYATEAVQGFLRLYWAKFPDGYLDVEGDEKDYVLARVNIENLASESILKKCGLFLLREEVQKDEKTGAVKIIREWKLWRPGKL